MANKNQTAFQWIEINRPQVLKVDLIEKYKGTPEQWTVIKFRARKKVVEAANEYLTENGLTYGLLARLLVGLATKKEIKLEIGYQKLGAGPGNIQKQLELIDQYSIVIRPPRASKDNTTENIEPLF